MTEIIPYSNTLARVVVVGDPDCHSAEGYVHLPIRSDWEGDLFCGAVCEKCGRVWRV